LAEPDSQRRRDNEERERRSWFQMAAIGMEFVVAILLFGGIGWWLDGDGRLGTRPWLMVAGFGVGFAVGLWMLIRAANKAFRD